RGRSTDGTATQPDGRPVFHRRLASRHGFLCNADGPEFFQLGVMPLMSPIIIAAIVFACIFGSALLGIFLRSQLPEHHLKEDSKEIVKLGTGLIATLAALVLGLLVASAKGSFDKVNDGLVQMAGKIILLDRVLALYGPDTKEIRGQIKDNYTSVVELLFSGDNAKLMQLDTPEAVARVEAIQVKLRELSPRTTASVPCRRAPWRSSATWPPPAGNCSSRRTVRSQRRSWSCWCS